MERRAILLGSGAVFATALAGCTSANSGQKGGTDDTTESDIQDEKESNDEKDSANNNEKDENEPDHGDDDEKKEHDNKKEEQQDIPGFDRDAFDIDSDVIRVKDITYRNHQLNIRVMVTTTDQDVLGEELRAFGPGFERAMRDTDVDAEEFFAEVKEIRFSVYDEHKNAVFAIFLDIRWLREFLDDEMTNDEFVDRILDQMEQA